MPKFRQKSIFQERKGLCQFLNIPIIYHHSKNRKSQRPIPEENAEQTVWQKLDSSVSLSLPLTAGIELISESLSIFNPGIFYTFFFLFWNRFGKMLKLVLHWTCLFSKLAYFQSLVLTRVQHQNFLYNFLYMSCVHSIKITYANCFSRGLNSKILHGFFLTNSQQKHFAWIYIHQIW